MSWNYRVVHRVVRGESIYAIHEAYYNGDKPTSISTDSIAPQGETLEELKQDVECYAKALAQPVLEYEDFERGGG